LIKQAQDITSPIDISKIRGMSYMVSGMLRGMGIKKVKEFDIVVRLESILVSSRNKD